ncbi:alanine--tRNA ligase [Candidatus Parcubacteria bacterium]|nr:MAG: alanine--tRNA ligase [Candidatus Parcubacteria bacterium]
MKANELRKKYLDFFKSKGHTVIPSAPLVPENDPSVLFTTAGMHPLVPYLLGQPHPAGTRLVDYQKCVRTGDIDEVGDDTHLTFFEMLGNWSLGDYFKKESIQFSFEFLTSPNWLGIDKNKLAISVFEGNETTPFDEVSYNAWLDLGIPKDRIAKLGKEDNWWPAGGKNIGPQGPDTEIFYWTGKDDAPVVFNPNDNRWVEIWNNVFMEFNADQDGILHPLKNKNVDTGMGLERTAAVLQGKSSVYDTELFVPIIRAIEEVADCSYQDNKRSVRIIADHVRTAVMMISDNVVPGNKDQGYVLRRLLRRAVRQMHQLGQSSGSLLPVAKAAVYTLVETYPALKEKEDVIYQEIEKEQIKFQKTIDKGLRQIKKIWDRQGKISGHDAFDLYQTYGFPLELTEEIAAEFGQRPDRKEFTAEFKKHQELSRTASAGRFKGGLADNSEQTTKLHTATHLMLAALRKYLGPEVHQAGSNINPERTRFDFTWPTKVSKDVLDKVEDYVNKAIEAAADVVVETMPKEEAKKQGVEGSFWEKYPDDVTVYTVKGKDGTIYSRELCGGPHVKNTANMGRFKIIKESSSSAGVRRIKATLE